MFSRIKKLNSQLNEKYGSKYKGPGEVLTFGREGLTTTKIIVWLFPGVFVVVASTILGDLYKETSPNFIFDHGVAIGLLLVVFGFFRLVLPRLGVERRLEELDERLREAQSKLIAAVTEEDDYETLEEAATELKKVSEEWAQPRFVLKSDKQ